MPSATIGRLLDRLGYTLLRPIDDGMDRSAQVDGVCFYDPIEPGSIGPRTVVLGNAATDIDLAARMIKEAGRDQATAVVLRDRLSTEDQVRAAARRSGVIVLDLVRGASWLQLATMINSSLTADRPATGAGAEHGGPDLFDLANTIADLVGGPVTIEDLGSVILAYSADQGEADRARQQSVLGHQVPSEYSDLLLDAGVFSHVYASAEPVFVPSIAPGVRPRTAMRLEAGGEVLGSIWVVVDEPLAAQQTHALTEAAGVVSLSLLRRRAAADTTRRMRSQQVAGILDGGPAARHAALRSGFTLGPACVLAIGVPPQSRHPAADLERLAGSLQMYLAAAHPSARSAVLGETVYVIQPLPDEERSKIATELAEEFTRRTRTLIKPLVGIGSVVPDIERVHRSRDDADAVLRVLAADPDRSRSIAAVDQVHTEILLHRFRDHLLHSDEPLRGPLLSLIEYDSAHDAGLVDTLQAWLESFGDVIGAAASLHIHKNTFRYRLRRLTEIADLDLSDPDTRLGLMLQLRVYRSAD